MIFDSHMDTPSEILRQRNLAIDNTSGHVDFPKLRRGGVDGSFFAIYTPHEKADAYGYASRMLDETLRCIEENHEIAALATSKQDALHNMEEGRFSVFIGMENGEPVGCSPERLEEFYRKGVRYLTLTHNGDNEIADSAVGSDGRWGGLSPFGREVVKIMNSLGMMVDLSHASDKTFWDCIELSKAPVVATHSCCRAICSHPRNLTDEMIRAIGEKDGYVGINFYPTFLSDDSSTLPGAKDIADHIDRAVKLAGLEHVGIGSDYDGIEITPQGMEDVSRIGILAEELRLRGYSETEINRIMGGNLLDVLERVANCSL